MARKAKKKVVEEPPPPASTEEESIHDDNSDEEMDSVDDIPDIVDKDDDDDDVVENDVESSNTKKKDKKVDTSAKKTKKKESKKSAADEATTTNMIPFMDTFYQLSSEESPLDRSMAARDLIHHCFLSDGGVNHKDAAYALTRLMNGICTGRAASRQGFASCLSSFLRVANSTPGVMGEVLKEDDYAKHLMGEGSTHPAMIIRQKLLSTTQVLPSEVDGKKGQKNKKKHHTGGKLKGIEERDHIFGRLFGILAVVRSGILCTEDVPQPEVIEGYMKDLIDLYHYKKWMRESSSHAIVELLSSLDAESNPNILVTITNNVIAPDLFLQKGSASSQNQADLTDRDQWLKTLTPEQLAVALHLQSTQHNGKYEYPLDEPVLTSDSVPTLSAALASTSSVVHPRCHAVWNSLWSYLTEEANETNGQRQLRSNEDFPAIISNIIQHVVVDLLLGKGGQNVNPTNERRSLALQIICALSGSTELKIALPPSIISTVVRPDVVSEVFLKVLCASGGGKKKTAKDGLEHGLKPLTFQALDDLVNSHRDEDFDVSTRLALAKAFIVAEPRFDTKTKTRTVSSLLLLHSDSVEASEESETKRDNLWQQYLSFLEEEIVTATSLHNATVYIELMYKLAKVDLAKAPASYAKRVVRFFLSGAFFDCSDLSDPATITKSSSKKKKKGKAKAKEVPDAGQHHQELSAGIRIKEILKANKMDSISHPTRAIMSARFYSLLSDFVSNIIYNRGTNSSKPQAVYRALSEISGITSLLETSGARKFPARNLSPADDSDTEEDPVEASRKSMLQLQTIANESLVQECSGGDEDMLRAKSVFATSCASLMMSLHLQLNTCGKPEVNDTEQGEAEDVEEEEDDVAESLHEYISDLADSVEGFSKVLDSESTLEENDDEENPLASMAGLLVNVLSSPVGGESYEKANPIQSSASKLTREIVKTSWSGVISVITNLKGKNKPITSLVDGDVMNILLESVCGEKSMDKENGDDESIEDSDSSEDELGESAVFVNAADAGMDLDDAVDNGSSDSEESGDESSKSSAGEDNVDEDVELDPARLENLLLEDSDAEMSDSGMLEHHAGADKALAQLIKLKQEARKASQTERERVEVCNRLRCAGLLGSLFSSSVFKSGWLPAEAVLGSIVPILRSRKALAKSIQSSSLSESAKKSLSQKNALLDHLSALVKDNISKFRSSDEGSSLDELALKVSADVFEEMKQSLNVSHCSCCSLALITAVRCISNAEENEDVKEIYANATTDWSSRKATKLHACIFDDLITRMPSLASLILVEPLITAASKAHSPYLKCESIKLLSAIYKHDVSNSDESMSVEAKVALRSSCSNAAETLAGALGDSNLQKAKHRDEVLIATKQFTNYLKAQDEAILTESEIEPLEEALKKFADNCNSAGMKQMCTQVLDTMSGLARKDEGEQEQKTKRSKTPKSSSKKKKTKKK